MGGGMRYLLYHILIGCDYYFFARCTPVVNLCHSMPKHFICYAFHQVNNAFRVHCLVFVQYLLLHCGDIRGDVGMVCHLVNGVLAETHLTPSLQTYNEKVDDTTTTLANIQ